MSIIVDRNKDLYVANDGRNQIISIQSNGFRCLVGCLGGAGTVSYQINQVPAFNFDSDGNLLALDRYNHRIEKFTLLSNYCNESSKETGE